MLERLLPGWFAHLPEQTQYNRRLRRLTPAITTVQLMVAELIAEGRVRLVDGNGGFWGAEYESTMELIDIQLTTPAKHKLGQRPSGEIAKARITLVIESLFSNLKRQMRLDQHLAKTKPGLAQRIVQRLLALTLGIYLNALVSRPPRALAAYDGR
ncbi:MAG TPA: hypothetical protein VEJ23_04985 [Solirubrobacteraceae bacterium]|nr:hypothetical protein [Solirubrobacteraceae bacterium]